MITVLQQVFANLMGQPFDGWIQSALLNNRVTLNMTFRISHKDIAKLEYIDSDGVIIVPLSKGHNVLIHNMQTFYDYIWVIKE